MKNKELKQHWKEATTYLKESLNYIFFAILIFLFSDMVGFLFRENFKFLDKFLRELLNQTQDLNVLELVFFILQNNLQNALMSIALGVFFGLFPIFSSLSNGAVIGYVLGRTYDIAGFLSWWRLLPHGIFELPAIFIALGLGTKLGFTFFQASNIKKEFKRRLYNSANAFLLIVIPLLIIAAFIEGLLIAFVN